MDFKRSLVMLWFFLVTFFPIPFLLVVIWLGLFSSAAISLVMGKTDLGIFLALAFVPVYYSFLLIISFRRYVAANHPGQKFLVMYISWLFAAFPIVFIVCNALGGTSMAVVDGPAGSYVSRIPEYLFMSCTVMFWGHIFFVSWIFLANRIFRSLKQA